MGINLSLRHNIPVGETPINSYVRQGTTGGPDGFTSIIRFGIPTCTQEKRDEGAKGKQGRARMGLESLTE